jgi:hypothetical protein
MNYSTFKRLAIVFLCILFFMPATAQNRVIGNQRQPCDSEAAEPGILAMLPIFCYI